MVIFIMGFSKSGTTMTARALHQSGIDFGIVNDGDYPRQPYEEEVGCGLIMNQIGAPKKDSLFIPESMEIKCSDIKDYIKYRESKSKNFGFKFPYITFVYDVWRKHLPKDHIAIALKRSPESLITHYTKNRKTYDIRKAERIWAVQKMYNNLIDSYKIPVLHFEQILSEGFGELEKIVGFKIKDIRNYKGIGDGKKYFNK